MKKKNRIQKHFPWSFKHHWFLLSIANYESEAFNTFSYFRCEEYFLCKYEPPDGVRYVDRKWYLSQPHKHKLTSRV